MTTMAERGFHRPMFAAVLLLQLPSCASLASSSIIKMERASHALAATLVYEGLLKRRDPLELMEDSDHLSFWFQDGGAKALSKELSTSNEDRVYQTDTPLPPQPEPTNNSPLLAARAKRAQRTKLAVPLKKLRVPVPDGAQPEGPETSATDTRSAASRGLVRAKLLALQPRRAELEEAIGVMLNENAATNLPAFDVAVLLVFLSELESSTLPVPVICKEAVELSRAYSGDEQGSHRHVNGLLASYARERLGRS